MEIQMNPEALEAMSEDMMEESLDMQEVQEINPNSQAQTINPSMREAKVSYEELKNICSQQQQYINKVHQELQFLKESLDVSRLEIMLKIIENSNKFSEEFIMKITKLIEAIITPLTNMEESTDKIQE